MLVPGEMISVETATGGALSVEAGPATCVSRCPCGARGADIFRRPAGGGAGSGKAAAPVGGNRRGMVAVRGGDWAAIGLDCRPVVRGRLLVRAPAGGRPARDWPAAARGRFAGGRQHRGAVGRSCPADESEPIGGHPAIGPRRSAAGGGAFAAAYLAAGEPGQPDAGRAVGGDSRARTGSRPSARLSGQPVANARRNGAVLSSGRLVAVASAAPGARKLLRRPGRGRGREPGGIRPGAAGGGRIAGAPRGAGPGGARADRCRPASRDCFPVSAGRTRSTPAIWSFRAPCCRRCSC